MLYTTVKSANVLAGSEEAKHTLAISGSRENVSSIFFLLLLDLESLRVEGFISLLNRVREKGRCN